MKQNITLSLDKDLIKKAKIIAAHRQTSVSQLLSQELKKIIQDIERYDWAKKSALTNLGKGFHLGGKGIASREDIHER